MLWGSREITPFSFLISLICVYFSWLAWLEVYQLYWSFERISFSFCWFSQLFLVFNVTDFCSNFTISSILVLWVYVFSFLELPKYGCLVIDFRSFFSSVTYIQCYNFLSKPCFCCIPRIFIRQLIFIHLMIKIVSF